MTRSLPLLKPTLLVFFLFLLITRFYNLENTARFIWDESSDLVNMHQIFVEKKLTLVGPISEDGTKVFGSLTYYLLLPFAAIGNFNPASPVYGAAFYGLITALLLFLLLRRIHSPGPLLPTILIISWFPLVQTSRWAWNPNFIPLWTTISLLLFLKNTPLSLLLSGFTIGLTIHHHYLSAFALTGFTLALLVHFIRQKHFSLFLLFLLGIAMSLTPFLIFDLRHPPGLFLTKILYFNHLDTPFSIKSFSYKFFALYKSMLFYFTQSRLISLSLYFLLPLLAIVDLKHRSPALIFFLPALIQLLGLTFIYYDNQSFHYFLPLLIFVFIWLTYPRKSPVHFLPLSILALITIASLFTIGRQITSKTWQTNIPLVRSITQTIQKEVITEDLKNSNLAVLSSPDNNTYGRRYRDLLLIQNIPLKTKAEYEISDHLFVISTSQEEVVRQDPAYEMKFFRSGPLIKSWTIPNSDWKIYRLDRNLK